MYKYQASGRLPKNCGLVTTMSPLGSKFYDAEGKVDNKVGNFTNKSGASEWMTEVYVSRDIRNKLNRGKAKLSYRFICSGREYPHPSPFGLSSDKVYPTCNITTMQPRNHCDG
jgi:hypothetical protein